MTDRIDELLEESKTNTDYTPDKRTLDAYASMLSTREGRRVMWDLLGITHYGLSSFTGDNNHSNFIAGKQKVGEYLGQMINIIEPDLWSVLTKEAREDEEYDRATADKRSDA